MAETNAKTEYLGDMTIVARYTTPTEARVVAGCLEAAGIPSSVADANIVQANQWMGATVGGVRLMVPAACVAEARKVMEAYEANAFHLDEDASPTPAPLPKVSAPLWSPDASAFWSLFLTPAFGVTLHFMNSRTLQNTRLTRLAWLWLVIGLSASAVAVYIAVMTERSLGVLFRASSIASAVTLVWYFLGGYSQSKYVVQTYGPKYAKRGLFGLVLILCVLFFALGAVGVAVEQ